MTDRTLIDTPLGVLFSNDETVIYEYINKLKNKTQNQDVLLEIARMEKLINSLKSGGVTPD